MVDGILDKVSKLASLRNVAESGRLQEEAAQRSQLKYMADEQSKQQKVEMDNMKYVTGKYTDLYFKAKGNSALQSNILETMNGMKSSLPPMFKQQFEVFTKSGPFSEISEKTRKFTEFYGEGPRPLSEEESKIPMNKGKHAFEVLDYNQKREHFITGQSTGKKRRFVTVGDGSVLGRTDDGFFYETSEEALGIQAIAKDFGVNPGKLLADDGFIFGTTRKGMVGGRNVTTTPYKDVLGNSSDGEDVNYGDQAGDKGKNAWQTSTLKNLIINFMGDGTGNSEGAILSRSVKGLVEDSGISPMTKKEAESGIASKDRKREIRDLNNTITNRLSTVPAFRNLNFKLFDPNFDEFQWYNPMDWGGAWGSSDKTTIIAIPGKPERVSTIDGHSKTLYNHQGEAYDGRGQYLGNWDTISQTINASTKADLLKG